MLRRYAAKLPFAITATVLGNTIEWFDFSLFGLMLPLFQKLFFPEQAGSLLYFLLLFAVGSIARPIGGIVFGYIGDRSGRKTALVKTIILMTFPLLLIGLLPSYRQIGVFAPIFLGVLYLLQGFCMGGEFPGSVVFLAETSPSALRGYVGSWAYFGPVLGMFLTSLELSLIDLRLSPAMFDTWGWRLPYLCGAILAIITIFLRRLLHETPIFQETSHARHLVRKPLWDSFHEHKKMLLVGLGLFTLDAIGFNLIIVFANYYYTFYFHLPLTTVFCLNLLTILTCLICIPLGGKLSIRVGNFRLAKRAIWSLVLFAIPLYLLILTKTLWGIFVGQFCLTVLLSFYLCNMPALSFHLFPTSIRYTCSALVINGSVALFGGTTPLFMTYLIDRTNPLIPSLYLIAGACISLVALRHLKCKIL